MLTEGWEIVLISLFSRSLWCSSPGRYCIGQQGEQTWLRSKIMFGAYPKVSWWEIFISQDASVPTIKSLKDRTRKPLEISKVLKCPQVEFLGQHLWGWLVYLKDLLCHFKVRNYEREQTNCLVALPVSVFHSFISEGPTVIINKVILRTSLTLIANNRDRRWFSIQSCGSKKIVIHMPCWSW